MTPYQRIFLPREEVLGFGSLLELEKPEFLTEMVGRAPNPIQISEQAEEKSQVFSVDQRQILVESIEASYANIPVSDLLRNNIIALKHTRTMTVTTGHQLALGTGPMFLIYKILHVINACRDLNERNDGFHYVPVFWMASEDHDYDEIKSLHAFGKKFTWETSQGGAVGRFSSEGLATIYDELKSLFRTALPEFLSVDPKDTYAQHFKKLINHIFGIYGLVVMDGDDVRLKTCLVPIFTQEFTNRLVEREVSKSNLVLASFGKKPQVMLRPINVFFLSDSQRTRVEEHQGIFSWGEHKGTLKELLVYLNQNPFSFSPNALMRPLFQELILPNVMYVGGGGELAYWTQLKSTFLAFSLPFPILQTRISAFILNASWAKYDLSNAFKPLIEKQNIILKSDEVNQEWIEKIQKDWTVLDATLESSLEGFSLDVQKSLKAEQVRLESAMKQYLGKWQKAQKGLHESSLLKVEKFHKHLYPEAIPQERYQNLLHFCPDGNWMELIEKLKEGIDPWSQDIHVFLETNEAK